MAESPVLLSLVLSTKGRTTEVAAFMESLAQQSCLANVELIISDQNEDRRLDAVLEPYRHRVRFCVVASGGGLSRGRNVGLALAQGALVAFPDDDCEYSPGVIEAVLQFFRENTAVGLLSVYSEDKLTGRQTVPMPAVACGVNSRFMPMFSPTMFVRRELLPAKGFDENLGVGTPHYGAGEETDLALSLLARGVIAVYAPLATVYHPVKAAEPLSRALLRRTFKYGTGHGKLLVRHRRVLGAWGYIQLAAVLLRPVLALPRGTQVLLRLANAAGVLAGMTRYLRYRD